MPLMMLISQLPVRCAHHSKHIQMFEGDWDDHTATLSPTSLIGCQPATAEARSAAKEELTLSALDQCLRAAVPGGKGLRARSSVSVKRM